ncbi:hypothetical protein [Enterococcus thailandicus]|uniref:hypothetical protein n=1 Tax=Enterococcus thailandicus TaxID=417368 RepID=UPI0022E7325F|nr:hypothetical protein [Enterococcus thailandicus]
MSNIKIGQIWENKHLFNDAYDVVVCWVTDGFVWMRYTNDDALFKESQSFFLRLRRLKSDSYFLNDNQQIVLEWLKKQRIQKDGLILPPMESISNLLLYIQRSSGDIFRCFASMSSEQQFEVLTAFAEWGLEQEGTE